MNKQKVKIDIVSDVNCPWCYIGEQRLNNAMKELDGSHDFEVNFKAFELNANIPQEGQSREAYFLHNYGPEFLPKIKETNKRITEAGKEEGIIFDFEKTVHVNNTFNSHRLIWLAEEYGVQKEVAEALFQAYFSEGKNMNDVDLLIEMGVGKGIPAERLHQFFSSEEGKEEVRAMEQQAQQVGINGVPSFIINNKYLVTGAQPAKTLVEVLNQVAPAYQEIKTEGDSCGMDGCC